MDAQAKPPQADSSLTHLLAALAPHDDKALVLAYETGAEVQPGYHVTEVKAGSFVTLDCGGNPDAWQETILQVEDIPARDSAGPMRVGKFRAILAQVDRKVRLAGDARVTVEVSRPGEPMKVYDVAAVEVTGERAVMRLGERPAICKPRHRARQQAASACCPPAADSSSCCR